MLLISAENSCAKHLSKTTIIKIPTKLANRMRSSGVYSENCPISIENLSLLKVPYYDFNGNIKAGDLIVLNKISNNVVRIFDELFTLKFPIYSIKTVDEYNGNDEKSMNANNTYGFCCRKALGQDALSPHAFGIAIDINPEQNPYLPGDIVYPASGQKFLDRSNIRPGMVENIVHVFKKHGFEWSGLHSKPDYHHFQLEKKYWDKRHEKHWR